MGRRKSLRKFGHLATHDERERCHGQIQQGCRCPKNEDSDREESQKCSIVTFGLAAESGENNRDHAAEHKRFLVACRDTSWHRN